MPAHRRLTAMDVLSTIYTHRMRLPVLLLALLLAPASLAQTDTSADRSAFAALNASMESAAPEQRLAYNALLVTFITFRDAHLRHEVCFNATNCSQLRAAERTRLNQDFLHTANGVAPPASSADDLTSADASLNAAFDKAMSGLPESCPGPDCLSKSSFQEVERDWIRYRDAFLGLAALRFPQRAREASQAALTRERTAQLELLTQASQAAHQ